MGQDDPVSVTAIVDCDDPVAEPFVSLLIVRGLLILRLDPPGALLRVTAAEAIRLAEQLKAVAGLCISEPTEGGADGKGPNR